MKPKIKFRKETYNVICKSDFTIILDIETGNKDGIAYLEIESSICSFQDGKKTLEKPYNNTDNKVEFTGTIECSQRKYFYLLLYAYAISSENNKSHLDDAKININCE